MTEIRRQRLRARVTLADVGGAIKKSPAWVCQAERGRIVLSAEAETHILAAIARLSALKKTLAETKARLVEDLVLPGAGSAIR